MTDFSWVFGNSVEMTKISIKLFLPRVFYDKLLMTKKSVLNFKLDVTLLLF